ncbi:hypothetical protein JCM14076_11230 [Methylosoma difficile]
MAFDLTVGKPSKTKGTSETVGCIDYNELPALSGLLEHTNSFFLHRVSNLFVDQAFSEEEVAQALTHLLPLLTQPLKADERALLHKLIAALSYAQEKQLGLYGVAD